MRSSRTHARHPTQASSTSDTSDTAEQDDKSEHDDKSEYDADDAVVMGFDGRGVVGAVGAVVGQGYSAEESEDLSDQELEIPGIVPMLLHALLLACSATHSPTHVRADGILGKSPNHLPTNSPTPPLVL